MIMTLYLGRLFTYLYLVYCSVLLVNMAYYGEQFYTIHLIIFFHFIIIVLITI